MSADGRRPRLAAALWLVFAFVVWHVRFDRAIETAARTYLVTQHQYVLGRAPSVSIDTAMRPAATAAALDATRWSAVIAVTGLTAVVWAARRPR
jgi:hypothetical protein